MILARSLLLIVSFIAVRRLFFYSIAVRVVCPVLCGISSESSLLTIMKPIPLLIHHVLILIILFRCQNYNIEDKSRDHEEDDRKRRRGGGDRGYSGPTQTFSEKKGYKPSVNIEYIDDSGRSMSSKEAFRYLSHKFHGKGSGKLKTEKRHRKIMEEKLMEKMSSTDTPLNTLTKLQHKTKEMATPYIVLSGNKTVEHTNLKK